MFVFSSSLDLQWIVKSIYSICTKLLQNIPVNCIGFHPRLLLLILQVGMQTTLLFSVVTGISALCRLTADGHWSGRSGPGSAAGQSSGSARDSWPPGSLFVSGGPSHAMHSAFHNLQSVSLLCCWGPLGGPKYIGGLFLSGQLRDVEQKELWLLMTGCRMCCGKPYCVLFGHPCGYIWESNCRQSQ